MNFADDGYILQITSGTLVPATSGDVDVTAQPVLPLVPDAPVLAPQSDTGVGSSDGLTRDNGSSAAPLYFTVSGVNPANSFVQIYNDSNPGDPVPLGSRVAAVGSAATITLSGAALPDGTYQIADAASLTSGGALSTLSGTTAITIQSSLTITATNPADGASVTALPDGQVSVTFSHALAGLTDGGPALSTSDPTALELTTQGGNSLTITTLYRVNADDTSTVVLTPISPPLPGVLSLVVDPTAFSDLAGNPLSAPNGDRFVFTITGPQAAPVTINPIPSQMVAPGGNLSVLVTSTGSGSGRTLLYSLGSAAPVGTLIDPQSGLFTWSPSLAQAGRTYSFTVTVAVQGDPAVFDSTLLSITVLSPPKVVSVNPTSLRKRRVNEGTISISLTFNQAMAPSASTRSFYSLGILTKVHTRKGTSIKLVPVRFTTRSTGGNTVTLTLAKPSKQHLTLTVLSGVPAANGLILGPAEPFEVQ